MSDNETNTAKKTLRLKSAKKKDADVAALGSDVAENTGGMPVIAASMGSTQVVDNSYTTPAIVAVIATVVFVVLVVLQMMELQAYSIPTLLQ
jgi:hypothetical protein